MSDTELPERPLDLAELLRTLVRHEVDFAVIGGVAAQVHGHRRTTRDLDIIPAPGRENLECLAAALAELDARPRGLPGGPPDAEQLAAAPVVPPLTTRHGELHVLNVVPGAPPYPELRRRALILELTGVELAVVALEDLIAMKRAAGRPRDLSDLDVLDPPEPSEGPTSPPSPRSN